MVPHIRSPFQLSWHVDDWFSLLLIHNMNWNTNTVVFKTVVLARHLTNIIFRWLVFTADNPQHEREQNTLLDKKFCSHPFWKRTRHIFYITKAWFNTRSVARIQDWVLKTVVLPRHLTNIIAIGNLPTSIAWLWDFAAFQAETSVRLMDNTLTIPLPMMTSSNGNLVRVTGLLWGESIGHGSFQRTKASDVELWGFLCAPQQTAEQGAQMPVIWDDMVVIVTSL